MTVLLGLEGLRSGQNVLKVNCYKSCISLIVTGHNVTFFIFRDQSELFHGNLLFDTLLTIYMIPAALCIISER